MEVDQETLEPTKKLGTAALDWCREIGSQAETLDDVLNGPDIKVRQALQYFTNQNADATLSTVQ